MSDWPLLMVVVEVSLESCVCVCASCIVCHTRLMDSRENIFMSEITPKWNIVKEEGGRGVQ